MPSPKPTGRPPLHDGPMRTHSVQLTEDQAAHARSLGAGQLAAGVREALRMAQEAQEAQAQ